MEAMFAVSSPGNASMFPDLSFTHDAPNICWNEVHEETSDNNLCTCERIRTRKNICFPTEMEEMRLTGFRMALLSRRSPTLHIPVLDFSTLSMSRC